MSSSKRWKFKNIFASKAGCGCGPKETDIIEPKPKPKPKSKTSYDRIPSYCSSSPASSWNRNGGSQSIIDGDEGYSSRTSSLNTGGAYCPEYEDLTKCSRTVSQFPKIRNSFVIVKDSNNPYEDFRQSMLQMIIEKEIYSRNDLQQLLQCFLQLNSPHHHEIIVRAFTEIWNGSVYSAAKEEAPPCYAGRDLM